MLIQIISALSLLFLTRLLPVILAPGFRPGDVRAHMLMIEAERKAPFFLWQSQRNYPVLFHSLLARLQLPLPLLHLLLPAVMDALVLLALGVFLNDGVQNGMYSKESATLALFLYVLHPAHLMQGVGPRSYGLNERIFSEALFSLALLLFLRESAITWIAGTFLSLMLVLSSRFATQALVFLFLPAGIISGNMGMITGVAISFLLALAMPGAHYRERLSRHVAHVLSYVKSTGDPRYWIGRRNRIPSRQGKTLSEWSREMIRFLARTNGISAGFIWHFPVLLALWFGFQNWPALENPAHLTTAFWIVVMAILAWVITSLGYFKVLGESERYLGYALVAACILIAKAGASRQISDFWILLVLFLAAVAWISAIIQLRKAACRHAEADAALLPFVTWLKEHPERKVATLLPTHESWILLQHLGDRVLWHELFFKQDWRTAMWRYPFPSCELIRSGKYDCLLSTDAIIRELSSENACYASLREGAVLVSENGYTLRELG